MTDDCVVYLVGAGPGDPGLITVAGAEALRRAQVVIYDFLANAELLKLCPPEAERIYVGKSGVQHTKTQEEINALLAEKAGESGGRTVVRLKGGDPYVFGRGGEEAEYLRERGIRFVVIPGITSGIAAAAYAGVPVTHRELTSTVTLVTGHEKDGADTPRVDYGALAALAKAGGTLVFYMGVKSLPLIVDRLTTGGLDGATPVAVVRWGTHAKQQTVVGTLQTIAAEVQPRRPDRAGDHDCRQGGGAPRNVELVRRAPPVWTAHPGHADPPTGQRIIVAAHGTGGRSNRSADHRIGRTRILGRHRPHLGPDPRL